MCFTVMPLMGSVCALSATVRAGNKWLYGFRIEQFGGGGVTGFLKVNELSSLPSLPVLVLFNHDATGVGTSTT